MATLSIFDTVEQSRGRSTSSRHPGDASSDYPIIEIGNNGTGLLVGGRFQVQIRSQDANFSKFDREDWLKKFDLANLARLQ